VSNSTLAERGEAAALTVDDLDWRAGEIEVPGKGNWRERLPLPVDVGQAIADYCRRGRRRGACRSLFLHAHAPYGGLTHTGINQVVVRACQRAGLPRIGAHIREELAQCSRHLGDDVQPWMDALSSYIDSRDDKEPIEGWHELAADPPDQPERPRVATPRIYVASLADYNNGTLHGRWIDADQDPDELRTEIQAMLERSTEPVAEEWAIHDNEGFGPFQVGEYESLEVVSAVALGIAECGSAFAAYASWAGTSEDALRQFDDCFLGCWPDVEAYARDLAADLGWDEALRRLPEGLQPYVDIDYQALARDLDSELTTVAGSGGVYIFREP
jgi:antirestriction protein